MGKTVIIIGTLDTKGQELAFIREAIERLEVGTIVMDTGVKGTPLFPGDITREEVAEVGGRDLKSLVEKNDRGEAIDVMMRGAAEITGRLYSEGLIDGVIGLGGAAGTTIGTHAMQALPVGVPKLMVSTMASGDTRPYVGIKDVTMMYSVVDIAGINSISGRILSNAAHAIAGMVANEPAQAGDEKPLIAATMFGVTTPCVTKAREYLESLGYEVLVFHATGAGGKAMEALIEGGYIKGVLDITTTEWCDELVGGILNAGPHRLEAAGKMGIPQVVSAGALDMVNFGPMDTVPDKFKNRILYKHNATVTLMRTTVEENIKLGEIIAGKLNSAQGPTALYIPLKGVSAIDKPGHSFYGPEEDKALFESLRKNINPGVVEITEMDNEINDEEFSLAMAKKLHSMIIRENKG